VAREAAQAAMLDAIRGTVPALPAKP
jgi:hypothetical protein